MCKQNAHTIYNTSKVNDMTSYQHFWARLSDNNACFKKEKKTRNCPINQAIWKDCSVTKPTKWLPANHIFRVTPLLQSGWHRSQGKWPPTATLFVNLDKDWSCKRLQYLFCTVLKGLLQLLQMWIFFLY